MRLVVPILLAVALGAAHPARAADPAAGRALAASCQACHRIDGRGTAPNVPNLGGQSEQYLVKQLEDFRAGRRENEQMSIIAESLNDAEIADLAAWYAKIAVTLAVPD